MYQQATALIAKKMTGGIVPLKPSAERNCAQKMANPVSPATPMNR